MTRVGRAIFDGDSTDRGVDLGGGVLRDCRVPIQLNRESLETSAAFRRGPAALVVDQDAEHDAGCDGEELASVAVGLALSNEPQIRLVHECRRLERDTRQLRAERE